MYIVLADGLHSHDNEAGTFANNRVTEFSTPYNGTFKTTSTGPRFVCQTCQESFSRPENLSRHRRSQHGSTSANTCRHCNKTFTRSDILKRHNRLKHAAGSEQLSSASSIRRFSVGSSAPVPSNGMRARTIAAETPSPESSNNGFGTIVGDVRRSSTHMLDGYRQAQDGYREFLGPQSQYAPLSPDADKCLTNTSRRPIDNHTTLFGSDDQHATLDRISLPSRVEDDYSLWLPDYLQDDPNSWIVKDTAPVLDFFNAFLTNPNPAQDSSFLLPDQTRLLDTPDSMQSSLQHDSMSKDSIRWGCSSDMHRKLVELWSSSSRRMETRLDREVISLWLSRYFERFQPQLPMFHPPSLDLDNTPPLIIGAIAAIGACQEDNGVSSHSMTVDFVRDMLHICLESQTQSPLVRILAHLLVMIAGLFVGDKQCYEVAEANRGSLMSLCRNVDLFSSISAWRDLHHERHDDDPDIRWKSWLRLEHRIRLAWATLLIDDVFPALMDLPAYHREMDLVKTLLPCDAVYWDAGSGREWSRLLGMSLLPPARPLRESLCQCLQPGDPTTAIAPDDSAVLSCITSVHRRIYDFRSQLALVLSTSVTSPPYSCAMGTVGTGEALSEYQALSDILERWKSMSDRLDSRSGSLNVNLATAFYHLGYIRLNVSVMDLYAAAGRGETGSKQIAPLIKAWTARKDATTAVTHAVKLLETLASNDGSTSPFYPFMVFVSVICLWAYLSYTDPSDTLDPAFVTNSNNIIACVQQHPGGPLNRESESAQQVISMGLGLLRRAEGWQISASLVHALRKLL